MFTLGWTIPNYIFSLSWDEWASVLAIFAAIVAILKWAISKVDLELFGPIRDQLQDVNNNLEEFNRRQSQAEVRLERGDKKFIRHEDELEDHERRITHLEEHNYDRIQ